MSEDAELLRKAAEQGAADAQLRLGVMYAAGRGVPKDGTKAVAWFRKAAAQGAPVPIPAVRPLPSSRAATHIISSMIL